jgi:hypothetical protein
MSVRTLVRVTFWVTLAVSGSAIMVELLQWFTWSLWYGIPQP